jgi:hypothetical protein
VNVSDIGIPLRVDATSALASPNETSDEQPDNADIATADKMIRPL